MAEVMENGIATMPVQAREIEAFRYAESPWLLDLAGAGNPLPELFPESEMQGSNLDGVLHRDAGRDVLTQRYTYGIEPGFAAEEETEDSGADLAFGDPPRDAAQEADRQQLFQQLLVSESNKAEERGRGKGMEMGLALGREEALRQLQGERERLVAQAAALVESFSQTQESYLHQLEQEAVKLALAIAARILRREAQSDPLLLTGAVRVALGQLSASTAVRLRVPAEDQPMWQEALARMPGLALRPRVIGEPGMELGDCQMETELGSVGLGLWPQLKAIERGFFERPGDRGAAQAEDHGSQEDRADGD
jgi:flagellar assembly protein FliH